MKKLTVTDKNGCAACLECQVACSMAYYKEFDQDKACIKITAKNGKNAVSVCPQCGKCAKVCEAGAITQNAKGVYMIDKKKCTGCFKCVEACPFGVMVRVEGRENPSKCIACGLCAKKCPMGILEIKEA